MAGELLPAPTETLPAPKPRYKRITQDQLRMLLPLRRQGKTQTEIAHILGCDQKTVSRWLADLTDSTEDATAYLRGKALPMAQNIVRKGKPDVQLKALQGLGVAAESESKQGVTVIVGGSAQVQVNLSPQVLSVQADPRLTERALSEPKG